SVGAVRAPRCLFCGFPHLLVRWILSGMSYTIQYANPPRSRMPMVVQTALYGMATVPFLNRCHRRYGDTFTVRLPGGRTMVVFADPADIKAVFALDADAFS